MSSREVYTLYPLTLSGHDSQLAEESFRLSALDIVMPPNYNTYSIVFKTRSESEDGKLVIETFKAGISAALKQCRHLAGTVEKNNFGDYSIVVNSQSAVKLGVHWLNAPESTYPSYSELEKDNFTCAALGDAATLGLEDMPRSRSPDDSPVMVGFQLNIIRGGFIFTVHVHHFALDMTGTSGFISQIAGHCNAIRNGTAPPEWDDSLMDRSRFYVPEIPLEDQQDPPPKPQRHSDWRPCSWLLFHLPPKKALELKQAATPQDGSWISTYDATMALVWRVMVNHRAHLHYPELYESAIFGEPINMRSRCLPAVSSKYQGNLLMPGLSQNQERPLSIAEVMSVAPLSRLAAFIRRITNSVSEDSIRETMQRLATYRDKSDLDMPLDSLSPMSFTTTDWRQSGFSDNDFGVGEPVAFRNLSDTVVGNMIVLYPPHKGTTGQEQGIEVLIPFERFAVDMVLKDALMKKYFEFRGFEAGAPE